jgi:hypothetical protein
MKPRPLHCKSDLINLVRDHTPTRACRRALNEGEVTVLGGFAPVQGNPRWIVQVESWRGSRWFIAVVVDEENHRFSVEYPETIDWADWDGDPDRGDPVRDGDDPRTFDLRRARDRHVRNQGGSFLDGAGDDEHRPGN